MLRSAPQRNKTSNLPAGVSRSTERGRWRRSKPCQTFGVFFHWPGGLPDIRKFRAGAGANDLAVLHAQETACAFRAEYVHCTLCGKPFDPSRYANWRSERLYPFQP